MSVLILVSNGDIRRSNRICSQDQHAQPLPLKLSLSLSLSPSLSTHDPMLSLSPSLSMHELSLSMPEPMLSLSMLILATTSVLSQRDGFRQPYSNFANRPHPLAQNRGTILMGIAVWRVAEKAKIAIWVGQPPPPGVTPPKNRPPPLGGVNHPQPRSPNRRRRHRVDLYVALACPLQCETIVKVEGKLLRMPPSL